jgi:hypothetical protein
MVTLSTRFQKKNWLKEKNLYKFREEKKFLASRKQDDYDDIRRDDAF